MKVTWKAVDPKADYSPRTGMDEQGNEYYMTANLEVVTVKTVDGKSGQGWTAEEALSKALGN